MNWHNVTPKDQARIDCTHCLVHDGKKQPAVVCQHAEWNTGNTNGISFWYLCLEHGRKLGYRAAA